MKSFIVFALLVAAACAAPASPEADALVVSNENNNIGVDGFESSYQTSNGISAGAKGVLKQIGDAAAVVHEGFYTYTGPDGRLYELRYTADENGFHPFADFLPVGPQ